MTIQLKIVNLDRTLPEGVVTTVHWTAEKVDGEYTAGAYGAIGVAPIEPTDPKFVKFEDLTEAEVVAWAVDQMGEEQLANLETSLDTQLENQKHPKQDSGLPW